MYLGYLMSTMVICLSVVVRLPIKDKKSFLVNWL